MYSVFAGILLVVQGRRCSLGLWPEKPVFLSSIHLVQTMRACQQNQLLRKLNSYLVSPTEHELQIVCNYQINNQSIHIYNIYYQFHIICINKI